MISKEYCIKDKEKRLERTRLWRSRNRDKIRIYNKSKYEERKEKDPEFSKKYYSDNRKKIISNTRKWQNKNKIKLIAYQKEYRKLNSEKISLIKAEWIKKKMMSDISFKLSHALRVRVNDIIKRNQRAGSAVKDLGCSTKKLKEYLEKKFSTGMNWKNWGVKGWHIDHIKPLSSFNLSNRKDFLKACHYTNLQPLWARDNIIKSNRS